MSIEVYLVAPGDGHMGVAQAFQNPSLALVDEHLAFCSVKLVKAVLHDLRRHSAFDEAQIILRVDLVHLHHGATLVDRDFGVDQAQRIHLH